MAHRHEFIVDDEVADALKFLMPGGNLENKFYYFWKIIFYEIKAVKLEKKFDTFKNAF